MKSSLVARLLPAEAIEINNTAMEVVNLYSKVSGIISRTHTAMGRKQATYVSYNLSTTNIELKVK